jgi:hypothetical protein
MQKTRDSIQKEDKTRRTLLFCLLPAIFLSPLFIVPRSAFSVSGNPGFRAAPSRLRLTLFFRGNDHLAVMPPLRLRSGQAPTGIQVVAFP